MYSQNVIEEAPNHDGSRRAFTMWQRRALRPEELLPQHSDYDRPTWSIQIYDVTPAARSQNHLLNVLMSIQGQTVRSRLGACPLPDRLEICGLPLPPESPPPETDIEIVSKCIRHLNAEIASRDATGDWPFFIPQTYGGDVDYDRQFIIVDRPFWRWNDREGGFLIVRYDSSGRRPPCFERCRWEKAKERLEDFRKDIEWFYDEYFLGGGLNAYLRHLREGPRPWSFWDDEW